MSAFVAAFWLAVCVALLLFGAAVVFNIGGLADQHARYLQSINKASRPGFARIPPWSLLIKRGWLDPDKLGWLYRTEARMLGLFWMLLGGAAIVAAVLSWL